MLLICPMKELLSNMLQDSIDTDKIPDLDYIDESNKSEGKLVLVMNSGECLVVTIEQFTP